MDTTGHIPNPGNWYRSAKDKQGKKDEIQSLLRSEGGMLLPLKGIRQPDDNTCGHTSLAMIANYYGLDWTVEDIRGLVPKKENTGGLSPDSILAAAGEMGLKAHKKYNLSFREIKSLLDDGIPVIMEVQAWPGDKVTDRDWEDEWNNGHYTVAMGYTREHLIFADPSSSRMTFMKFEDIIPRWHDNDYGRRNRHLCIVVDPVKGVEEPRKTMTINDLVPMG